MKYPVSICIPTYNGAKYLKECLDSVISQTFADFEVLIVDDQSSDETLKIAQEYAKRDSRLRVIVNEHNLGLVGNWNRCVELAQGEWIKFVFQDDLIEPKCLERMLAASKPEIPIIFCRRKYIFESGTSEEAKRFRLSMECLPDQLFAGLTEIPASDVCQAILKQIKLGQEQLVNFNINFVGEPVAILLHRSVFSQFGFFNTYMINSCDLEFCLRLAIHTGIIYVPENLAIFRVHGESATARKEQNYKYRGNVLDHLIMMHDFVFNPNYAPLRATLEHQGDSVNLVKLLSVKTYAARRMAERAAVDTVNPNSQMLADWENLIELYPILAKLSQWNLLRRIAFSQWNLLRRIARYVKIRISYFSRYPHQLMPSFISKINNIFD